DKTKGDNPFDGRDAKGSLSNVMEALALFAVSDSPKASGQKPKRLLGRYVRRLSGETPLSELTDNRPLLKVPSTSSATSSTPAPRPQVVFSLADGSTFAIDTDIVAGLTSCGELIDCINNHPANNGRIVASITQWTPVSLLESQFVDHLVKSVTFNSRSLETNEKLTDIIRRHGRYSLALTVPALVMGWALALIISSLVAYYRGRAVDKIGVFLSVLGMCIPFLAFMIYGQWLMFVIAPIRAYGIFYRSNIYVPILIMVIAGLGGSVRFYRTIILDEVNRDYVRTARAKGAPLSSILFKHVLKNCMLPILTNLILALPFLIMGSLLVETYFGIPGLGDLMITSVTNRDEPIINAMVFLTSVIYTLGIILTDICYGIFDPRIRLR
ncbi:MAG: ABC transporter permease, partial [Planctomycetes bacterium]|nr:ABC transporter permease [Planctomycetota bacterium]